MQSADLWSLPSLYSLGSKSPSQLQCWSPSRITESLSQTRPSSFLAGYLETMSHIANLEAHGIGCPRSGITKVNDECVNSEMHL